MEKVQHITLYLALFSITIHIKAIKVEKVHFWLISIITYIKPLKVETGCYSLTSIPIFIIVRVYIKIGVKVKGLVSVKRRKVIWLRVESVWFHNYPWLWIKLIWNYLKNAGF